MWVFLFKVERNFILVVIFSYFDRDDYCNKKEGNFEGFIFGKLFLFWNDERIFIVFEEVNEIGLLVCVMIWKNIGNGVFCIWDWELGVYVNRVFEE